MKVMKVSIFLFVALFSLELRGQNLVPNPSFENFSLCPTLDNQLNRAIPWFNPTGNTSDYFNVCYIGPSPVPVDVPSNFFGYQFARTGDGYAGLTPFYTSPNGREYIEVRLLDSLRVDKNYCVTFYVSSADSSTWATSRIGAYFSPDTIQSPYILVLNYVPQVENLFGNIISDANNWTKVSGVFTAGGGEKFLTIGNFYNDANTDTIAVGNYFSQFAYFYIDDVSVYELPQDSTNCFDGVGVNEIEKGEEILVYPNPAKDKLVVVGSEFGDKAEIIIYNLIGETVYKSEILPRVVGAKSEIDVSALPNGIYFLFLKNKEKTFSKKFVKM